MDGGVDGGLGVLRGVRVEIWAWKRGYWGWGLCIRDVGPLEQYV